MNIGEIEHIHDVRPLREPIPAHEPAYEPDKKPEKTVDKPDRKV